ncbi:MAG TPA: endolytic transglycosylase MltG [Pyrinomonadaceae bacterium]|nr:endolytic transglycosylase MltG [Pyrinomonadaceae bacterium]
MRLFRLLLLLLLLGILSVSVFAYWSYRELHSPVLHAHESDYIEIPRGSSPDQIVSKLAAHGVIRREWLFRLYLRLSGAGSRLKAGEYRFPSPITPMSVLSKLEEGEQRLSRFTVVEGWTRWDIAGLMARMPELKLGSAEEALALFDDTSEIRDLDPQAPNLEGYLFPDTYSFPPNTSAQEIVRAMVRRFRQVWDRDLAAGAQARGKSVREIVTIASLIETEAKLKEERALVSSVIYNRLRIGMPLGIDSTVIYASKLAGKWRNDGKVYQSDLDRNSPYNTRKVRGLPPGPIASPGARALEAAVNPADTSHLYYVRNPDRDDGAHNFYDNEADFARGVQALREWERQRDARARESSEGEPAVAPPTPTPTPSP